MRITSFKFMSKLPYGINNFERIITERYAYIDKTRFIEQLEDEPNPYQLFIRPHKFGKSLLITTLSCYYDLNYANTFERLFKKLHIGKYPTSEHNRFAILKFDFSSLNTSAIGEFTTSFYDSIKKTLLNFVETYRSLFHDPDELSNMLQANGLMRNFCEILKIGTKSVVNRIFITGTSPMMMNDLIDASGIDRASIAADLADDYNGYLFSKDAKTHVFNPATALYYLSQIRRASLPPKYILDSNLHELRTRNLNKDLVINGHEKSSTIRTLAYDGNPIPYIGYMCKNIFNDVKCATLLFIGNEAYRLVPVLLIQKGAFFRLRQRQRE